MATAFGKSLKLVKARLYANNVEEESAVTYVKSSSTEVDWELEIFQESRRESRRYL